MAPPRFGGARPHVAEGCKTLTIMTGIVRIFAVLGLVASTMSIANAKCGPLHVLSEKQEKLWTGVVKNRKTGDGATVAEVLRYVEQMRPAEFKVETIEVGYNCASGQPSAVAIGYWIGMKRLPGDVFIDLGYDAEPGAKGLTIKVPEKPIASERSITEALEAGRDAFLEYVDEMYQSTCIDGKRKLC